MIFDYIRPAGFAAERMEVFGPRYYWVDEEEDFRYDRLPDEADVEYLLIEGIYTSWQATGDDAWMARQLPGLEKAVEYMMGDPVRWSEKFGLVKRAYTIDTWDFKFFGFDRSHLKSGAEVQDAVFNVHDDTPMCIMHGDNSGMYQACRQMAAMFGALGNEGKRAEYDGKAEMFRANTDKHCWNGRYYDHWVPVTPLDMDQGGVDGCKVLSLSNPYDVNRGLPDHGKAAAIVRTYMDLREELKETHFAEWLSAYPCWPKGFSGIEADSYVNGGIIIIVAGELAKAGLPPRVRAVRRGHPQPRQRPAAEALGGGQGPVGPGPPLQLPLHLHALRRDLPRHPRQLGPGGRHERDDGGALRPAGRLDVLRRRPDRAALGGGRRRAGGGHRPLRGERRIRGL